MHLTGELSDTGVRLLAEGGLAREQTGLGRISLVVAVFGGVARLVRYWRFAFGL